MDKEAPATRRPRKKQGYHHRDLRAAVIQTALELTAQRGGPYFSLREVAQALGVAHTAVYRHFANKAALYDVLIQEGFIILHRFQTEEQDRAAPDPLSRLQALTIAYLRLATEETGFFRMLFENRPGLRPDEGQGGGHQERAFETLLSAIRSCQEAGLVVAGDPAQIAGYLLLAPHGLAAYLTQPVSPGLVNERPIRLMRAEDLAIVGILPVLTNPPPPEDIAQRFFRRTDEADEQNG